MKWGVVLCDCNNSLSEIIDYKKVEELAKSLEGVVKVKRTSLLCKNPEKELEDFKGLDGIIFCGCSERYSLTFNEERISILLKNLGIDQAKFEVAAFREHCAWIHAYDPDAATRKAMDQLLIAYEKLKSNEKALKFNKVTPRVLVVGGGVAGLACALSLHQMGIEVDLVEKDPYIGGHAIQTFRVWQSQYYPSSCTTACSVLSLVRLSGFAGFSIFTNTEVKEVHRENGNFIVELLKKPLFVDPLKCCSCGKCAEVCPIETDNPFELGLKKRKAIDKDYNTAIPDTYYIIKEACNECGKCVEVCPSSAINLQEESKIIKKEYGAVVLATGFYSNSSNSKISFNGKNILSPMQLERLLDNRFFGKRPKQVAFIIPKEEMPNYCAQLSWAVVIKLVNILQARMKIKTLIFYEDYPPFTKTMRIFKEEAEAKGAEFIQAKVNEVKNEEKVVKIFTSKGEYEATLAVLSQSLLPETVRLAEKFGVLVDEDGFPIEFQPKVVNPLETYAERIFVAGCAKGCNKDVQDSVESGYAVAVRVYNVLKGKEQKFYSITVEENCSKCGLCAIACPHSAIIVKEDEVKIDPAFCKGCGLCYAVCPSQAIRLINMENEQILKMAKVAFTHHIPEDGPRVLVFLCYWCSHTAADIMGFRRLEVAPNFRAIRVRCSASVDPYVAVEIIEKGYADRVLITGCPPKNCHHFWGNYIEKRRIQLLNKIFESLGKAKKLIRYEYIGVSNWDKLAQIINQMCEDFEM